MNLELEALLQALDAVRQTSGPRRQEFRAIYEAKLDAVRERHPSVSRTTLERLVQTAYAAWLRAQDKPSTLPPAA